MYLKSVLWTCFLCISHLWFLGHDTLSTYVSKKSLLWTCLLMHYDVSCKQWVVSKNYHKTWSTSNEEKLHLALKGTRMSWKHFPCCGLRWQLFTLGKSELGAVNSSKTWHYIWRQDWTGKNILIQPTFYQALYTLISPFKCMPSLTLSG